MIHHPKDKLIYRILRYLRLKLSCDIDDRFKNSVMFEHPVGVVFCPSSCGINVRVWQNVTVGAKRWGEPHPCIGNNVKIYAGAIVVGNIRIGDRAVIGAGSIVLKDVPDNTTVVGLYK